MSLQSSKTQTSVTLAWTTNTNTYQNSFRVRYKGTATSTSWSSPEDIQETEKMYDGLLPGDKYEFEVWARSGTEDSTKENITVVLGEKFLFLYSYTCIHKCWNKIDTAHDYFNENDVNTVRILTELKLYGVCWYYERLNIHLIFSTKCSNSGMEQR